MQNFYCHYKYVCRHLLILKYFNINSYLIPNLNKLHLFFFIYDTTYPDARSGFNYQYLFKFFFGISSYVCKYTTRFHLNIWYHSFYIQSTIKNSLKFFFINLLNQIFFKLKKEYYTYFWKNMCIFRIKDMTLFLEVNQSTGLFNLVHELNFKFFFKGILNHKNEILTLFKFKYLMDKKTRRLQY